MNEVEEIRKLRRELDDVHEILDKNLRKHITLDKWLIGLIVISLVLCLFSGVRYMNNSNWIGTIFFALLSAINGVNGVVTVKRLVKNYAELHLENTLYQITVEEMTKDCVELEIEL